MTAEYDALLIVGFGGPEGKGDVLPFLDNVTRGRNIPRERLLEVAEHYNHFDGVSPINGQVRELIAALEPALRCHGIDLPVYWGNRNWHPLLPDTVRSMAERGVKRALAFVLSAYSSYSGCRQYLDNIAAARAEVGNAAPAIDKIRAFFNHPNFIAASADRLQAALDQVSAADRPGLHVAFTAHSIPTSMAQSCRYETELEETCRLVADACSVRGDGWRLVYQSRSGRPTDPWLEPDILDHMRGLYKDGVRRLVIMPIGFLSDHIEVLYDLDCEAAALADELGMRMIRAHSVGAHPRFVQMVVELVRERLEDQSPRSAAGNLPAAPDECRRDCCPLPRRPPD